MPAPLTSEKNRLVFTKIIVIYALFYVAMKVIAIFTGAWVVPNLVLCVPFVLLALWGWAGIKRNATNWLYVIVSIVIISAIRFYEKDLMFWLSEIS